MLAIFNKYKNISNDLIGSLDLKFLDIFNKLKTDYSKLFSLLKTL